MFGLTWEWTPYMWPNFILAAIVAVIVARWWQDRHTSWVKYLLYLGIASGTWCFLSGLGTAIGPYDAKIVVEKLRYLAIPVAPVLALQFILAYTGHRLANSPKLRWLYLLPFIVFLSAITAPINPLYWSSLTLDDAGLFINVTYGPLFWVWVVYGYGLMVTTVLILLRAAGRVSSYFRRQTDIIFIALLVPWVANITYVIGWRPLGPIDPSPLAFSVTFLILHWGTLYHGLLELNPIDRASLMEDLLEGIIVIRGQDQIVDINTVAAKMLSLQTDEALGRPLSAITPRHARALIEAYENGPGNYEIDLSREEQPLHVRLRITPLYNQMKEPQGYSIVIQETTARVLAQTELFHQVKLLQSLVQIGRQLLTTTGLSETLEGTLEMARALTNAAEGSLFLLDESGRIINRILARKGATPAQIKDIESAILDVGLAGLGNQQPGSCPHP